MSEENTSSEKDSKIVLLHRLIWIQFILLIPYFLLGAYKNPSAFSLSINLPYTGFVGWLLWGLKNHKHWARRLFIIFHGITLSLILPMYLFNLSKYIQHSPLDFTLTFSQTILLCMTIYLLFQRQIRSLFTQQPIENFQRLSLVFAIGMALLFGIALEWVSKQPDFIDRLFKPSTHSQDATHQAPLTPPP